MATDIRVPTLGESVTEATIGKWFKKPGEAVKADEPLVELETDKVTLEVNAPTSGVLSEIVAKDGETVGVGALLGSISAGGAAVAPAPAAKAAEPAKVAEAPKAAAPAAKALAADTPQAPSVQRLASESGVDPAGVAAAAGDRARLMVEPGEAVRGEFGGGDGRAAGDCCCAGGGAGAGGGGGSDRGV
jgi:2-oxoglutarate dehydrogenase E2 component (dihydrolipoamide succinyltransferase)